MIKRLILLLGLLIIGLDVRAEIVVITHPDTQVENIDRELLRELWLGTARHVNRIRVYIIDLAEGNDMRDSFYLEVIGMSSNQLKAHWAKTVFMGQGFPPRTLDTVEEVIEWVLEQPDRLGYIDSDRVDGSARVVWRPEDPEIEKQQQAEQE